MEFSMRFAGNCRDNPLELESLKARPAIIHRAFVHQRGLLLIRLNFFYVSFEWFYDRSNPWVPKKFYWCPKRGKEKKIHAERCWWQLNFETLWLRKGAKQTMGNARITVSGRKFRFRCSISTCLIALGPIDLQKQQQQNQQEEICFCEKKIEDWQFVPVERFPPLLENAIVCVCLCLLVSARQEDIVWIFHIIDNVIKMCSTFDKQISDGSLTCRRVFGSLMRRQFFILAFQWKAIAIRFYDRMDRMKRVAIPARMNSIYLLCHWRAFVYGTSFTHSNVETLNGLAR